MCKIVNHTKALKVAFWLKGVFVYATTAANMQEYIRKLIHITLTAKNFQNKEY